MPRNNTTPSAVRELSAALDTLLDLYLDGRMEPLNEDEEAAVKETDVALKKAGEQTAKLLELCQVAQTWADAWLKSEPKDFGMQAFHADLTAAINGATTA